jgi:hypothetical protein
MAGTALQRISGISSEGEELLLAVGVEGIPTLSKSNPKDLLEEMEQANRHLELVAETPSEDQLASWIEKAREIAEEEGVAVVPKLDEVVEMVPVEVLRAVPVSKQFVLDHQIKVSEVPVMDEFCSKEDLFEERVFSLRTQEPVHVPVREITPKKSRQSDASEESGRGERKKVEPLKRNVEFDIRKTATPELNAGKKSFSRSYIRGVLHPQPLRVRVGGIFTLAAMLLFPLTLVAGGLMVTIFSGRVLEPENIWLLAFPVALVIFSFFYLIVARPVKCRVCGQPLFSPKACRRNPKAHHLPFFGYILPTTVQMLIFHWFRCMYCGTSIRLKK